MTCICRTWIFPFAQTVLRYEKALPDRIKNLAKNRCGEADRGDVAAMNADQIKKAKFYIVEVCTRTHLHVPCFVHFVDSLQNKGRCRHLILIGLRLHAHRLARTRGRRRTGCCLRNKRHSTQSLSKASRTSSRHVSPAGSERGALYRRTSSTEH